MKKVLLGILVMVLVLLPIVGCAPDPAKDIKALKESVDSLVGAVNEMSEDVAQLQSDVGTLQRDMDDIEVGDTSELLDMLDEFGATLDDLSDTVADLQDDVADLQGDGNGDSTTNDDGEYFTTRWSVDVEFEPMLVSSEYDVDVSWYPTRIRDEDTYRFRVDVTAIGSWDEKEIDALWISFSPTSRDTSIDIGNTGIYSVSPIGIWWDSEYSPSNGVDCRSMVFVSDDFDIPGLVDGETYTIRFDFDLYYQ